MATITAGTGIISGIDTASLIDQLIAIEKRPIQELQTRVDRANAQKTAYLDLSANILALKTSAGTLGSADFFQATEAASSNSSVLAATVTGTPAIGSYSLTVSRLVRAHQVVSQGYASADVTPVGGKVLTIEVGGGFVDRPTTLSFLNGQTGVSLGSIRVTDRTGASAVVDLTTAVTVQDVLNMINAAPGINVTASAQDNHLVITDNTGQTSAALSVQNVGYTRTATDLGLAGSVSASQLVGADVNLVTRNTALDLLNQGNGVRTESGLTDLRILYSGGTFDLNLSSAVTLGDVLDAVNNASGNNGNLTASVGTDGVSLVLTDATGGLIRVSSLNNSNAARDLGLVGRTSTGGTLSGDALIPELNTVLLRTLNGGAGIGGLVGATSVEDLNAFSGIATGTIHLRDRSGAEADVLINGGTIADVVSAINGAGTGVTATVDGDHLVLYDTTGATNYTLAVTDVDSATALSLGIRQEVSGSTLSGNSIYYLSAGQALADLNEGLGVRTVAGTDFNVQLRDGTVLDIDLSTATTLADVITLINEHALNGGKLTAQLSGSRLVLTDHTGASDYALSVIAANESSAALDLGLPASTATDTLTGQALLGSLSLGTHREPGSVFLEDRTGATATVDLAGCASLTDVLDAINGSGLALSASINDVGNGIEIVDTSGATGHNLVVSSTDDTADTLGISTGASGLAGPTLRGEDLELQYLTERTTLAQLNGGQGVYAGKFRIVASTGASAVVDLSQSDDTHLSDVISEINSRGIGVTASINSTGDGLLLTDTTSGTGRLRVEEMGGTTAHDLNILGQGSADSPHIVNGSFEYHVDISSARSLQDVVKAINDSGAPVFASVINDGTGTNPYRLNLVSSLTGSGGRMLLDAGDSSLVFTTIEQAQDAAVLLGSNSPGSRPILLTSPTNTLENVIDGLRLDLVSTSAAPITVTVTRNTDAVVTAVSTLVDQFNAVRSRTALYTSFNPDTLQRGVLLGDGTLQSIEMRLNDLLTARLNVTGSITGLYQLGVSFDGSGKLKLDESKLRQVLSTDPAGVMNFFTADTAGFADMLGALVDAVTDKHSSTIGRCTQALDDRIRIYQDRMQEMSELVALKQTQLLKRFAQMEVALARLQQQSNSISQIMTLINNYKASPSQTSWGS